ncbi:MAG: UDP-N-acetylglucosamine 2-epimerase [Pseudolabrys sp.]|nr:UDP-N-acetylglucosamine 2-epimerase [Pseudolabrys sp.]MDP2295561.1 UDP-N-acetylglucosamine 2-epimerase [Pseudolabrys sp.]
MADRKRKVCVVTGSRAEYGLLYWLLRGIQAEPSLQLQLVVTGMHLSPQFGMTVNQIEADGFAADAKVDMQLTGDTPKALTRSMGLGLVGLADAFESLQPDIVVVLGDRYEIFAVAQAAMVARIPIAHIHGGELTEGAIDDAIRHAITKMAHLHFVAAEEYRKRVIQLGEAADRVWNVGAPGLDAIRKLTLLDRAALSKELEFDVTRPFFLVTYHPVTLAAADEGAEPLFRALETFADHVFVITGVNADTGHEGIRQQTVAFAKAYPGRVLVRASLGQLRYLSAMAHADAVIGNSSSGLIEAPALKVPTVNIGERQRGRLRPPSVIDVENDTNEITAAIKKALNPEFRDALRSAESIFGDGFATEKMIEVLRDHPLKGILRKHFHDQ